MSKDLSPAKQLTMTEAVNLIITPLGLRLEQSTANLYNIYGSNNSLVTKKGALPLREVLTLLSKILLTRQSERNFFLKEASRSMHVKTDELQRRAKAYAGSYTVGDLDEA